MAKRQTDLSKLLDSDEGEDISVKANKENIRILEKKIEFHRDLYYNKLSEISDAQFDALEDELRTLDPNNPILQKIGQDASPIFTKREHIITMGSQDKVVSPEDFMSWTRKRALGKFLVQYKLDGISIELQYRGGVFQCAVTRGDGKVGDDVSYNVMKMKGFVPRINAKFTGAVRAEVLLFHDIYNSKYNDMQNCRNAAGGIVRRKDGEGSSDLNLIFYDAVSLSDDVIFTTEVQKVKWLTGHNFDTVPSKNANSVQQVIDIRDKVIEKTRDELDFDIDGLVIKSNEIDIEDMERLRPMKQVAFKLPAEVIKTILRDVEWSISGHNYTPVAIVDPVILMGSNVSRASLANPDLIKTMGIKIGSEVLITKRGDIIPKIEEVLNTPHDAKEIKLPESCEVCNTALINEGTRLYCPNEMCPKRKYHRIIKWIKILDIKHFSEKLIVSELFNRGILQTIADLYKLSLSDLVYLDGVQEKSAQKALDNLYNKKEIALEKFIAGFNIEGIAEEMAKKVIDGGFDTLDKIRNASITELSNVYGLAEITAKVFHTGMKKLTPEMDDVLKTGKVKIKTSSSSSSGILIGKSFCFTGKLNKLSRKEAEALVTQHGGTSKSSVTSNLSYLVTNSTEQTTKYMKAQQQKNTKIITEEEFIDLVSK